MFFFVVLFCFLRLPNESPSPRTNPCGEWILTSDAVPPAWVQILVLTLITCVLVTSHSYPLFAPMPACVKWNNNLRELL